VFKKGDLFFLNEEGKILFHHVAGENGIVMSDPYLIVSHDDFITREKIEYYGYDVLIKGRLFIEMPEEFLVRVTKNEENFKRVE
jgi:hypothetical protein